MKAVFTEFPLPATAAIFFALGLCVGHAVFRWIIRLTYKFREDHVANITGEFERTSPLCAVPVIGPLLTRSACPYRGARILGWGTLVELITGLLYAGFVIAKLKFHCQDIPAVQPDEVWRYGRIVYHLVLVTLLIAATGTDFREYIIPDRIVLPGIVIAVTAAFLSGDLQTVHLWVDANEEIPGFRGPFIPEWIKQHHHWHGLAWSLAGLLVGAVTTWLLRAVSSLILGEEAMGFGDVTLMAMIGSFLGWQPVLIVLALSPFCGVVMAIGTRIIAGRTYVPFGPYLSLAALVVLFGWRWIWTFKVSVGLQSPFSVRKLFGDWIAVLILIGIAFGLLIVLLGLLRIYRSIPVQRSTVNAVSERSLQEDIEKDQESDD